MPGRLTTNSRRFNRVMVRAHESRRLDAVEHRIRASIGATLAARLRAELMLLVEAPLLIGTLLYLHSALPGHRSAQRRLSPRIAGWGGTSWPSPRRIMEECLALNMFLRF